MQQKLLTLPEHTSSSPEFIQCRWFLASMKKKSRMCCIIVMVLCLHSSTSKMSNYWEIKCFQNLLIWEDTYEQWPKEKGHIKIYKTLHRKIPEHLNSSPVFSGIRIARLCFVDRCLSFYLFSFRHCILCPPITLLTPIIILKSVWYNISDFVFVILFFCCPN